MSHRLSPLRSLLRRLAQLAVAASCACSGGGPDPLACEERAQCPSDAFCRAGACVRSAAPIALIGAVDSVAVRANRVVSFDAAGSRDPDAEDRVVAYAWSAVRVDAACEPVQVEADGARYRVLFPCAGAFRVELQVTDSAGVASATARAELAVAPDDSAAPVLQAAPALALDHRCTGEPLACTPVDATGATTFSVSATVAGGRAPVSLKWTATPPSGISPRPTVAFSDATAAAPVVSLRTAGAIAGTWTFRALATDADGRAAVAEQKVTVGNRAPAPLRPLALALDHRFDSTARAYRADGQLPADLGIVDPDGDPVTLSFAAEASGDGGLGFSVREDGSLSIAVPASEPDHLLGPGVQRRVVVTADDANGSASAARIAVPVTILNRAPRLGVARGAATIPHRYDGVRRVYSAVATLSEYVDDDGDPILAGRTVEVGSRGCASVAMDGRAVKVSCEVPLSTVSALAVLAGTHVLDVTVRDAWTESAPAAARIDITNAAPVVASDVRVVAASHQVNPNLCCEWFQEICEQPREEWGAARSTVTPVTDPDGDPLDVTYESSASALQLSRTSATACVGEECATELQFAAAGSMLSCQPIPDPGTLRTSATDGAASAVGVIPVRRSSR